MKTYRLNRKDAPKGLALVDEARPALQPSEVRVQVNAVSLNARDLLIHAGAGEGADIVPCSDGAGVVVETGSRVTKWKIGDRVFAAFYPSWISGPMTRSNAVAGLGGSLVPGVLREELVSHQDALVRTPAHLSDVEASTIPCAGVTAWNALFRQATPRPGSTVVVLGSGGVSIWALQLAAAAGLRVIATTSTEDKAARLRQLGAHEVIDYKRSPKWSERVLSMTDDRGADLVIDVGGKGTLQESIAATRPEGTIALVGGVSGDFAAQLPPDGLTEGAHRICGIRVGSRETAEELCGFLSHRELHPVIDRVFDFANAGAAYDHLATGRHVGKVVIRMP